MPPVSRTKNTAAEATVFIRYRSLPQQEPTQERIRITVISPVLKRLQKHPIFQGNVMLPEKRDRREVEE